MAQAQMGVQAGGLSIRPFQVSRWRLRRARQLWVFNAVLVLRYGLEGAFLEIRIDVRGGRWLVPGSDCERCHRHFLGAGRAQTHVDRGWQTDVRFGPRQLSLRAVHGVPFSGSQVDLPSRELLHDFHGAATAWARPGGGRRRCRWRRRARPGYRERQQPAANRYGLSAPRRGKETKVADAHKAAR